MEEIYGLLGDRPVKSEFTSDGGLGAYAFNHSTGIFELDMNFLTVIYVDYYVEGDPNFTRLSKKDFDDYVMKLRKSLGFDVSEP